MGYPNLDRTPQTHNIREGFKVALVLSSHVKRDDKMCGKIIGETHVKYGT